MIQIVWIRKRPTNAPDGGQADTKVVIGPAGDVHGIARIYVEGYSRE
jgi:hypothetical protein